MQMTDRIKPVGIVVAASATVAWVVIMIAFASGSGSGAKSGQDAEIAVAVPIFAPLPLDATAKPEPGPEVAKTPIAAPYAIAADEFVPLPEIHTQSSGAVAAQPAAVDQQPPPAKAVPQYHNGRWWFRKPDGSWLVWSGGTWVEWRPATVQQPLDWQPSFQQPMQRRRWGW